MRVRRWRWRSAAPRTPAARPRARAGSRGSARASTRGRRYPRVARGDLHAVHAGVGQLAALEGDRLFEGADQRVTEVVVAGHFTPRLRAIVRTIFQRLPRTSSAGMNGAASSDAP